MPEIVNLRQARKRKARAEKERAAEANRRAHGAPKAEKTKTRLLQDLDAKRLEAHRRDEQRRRRLTPLAHDPQALRHAQGSRDERLA